jgi:hypothetical protein
MDRLLTLVYTPIPGGNSLVGNGYVAAKTQ